MVRGTDTDYIPRAGGGGSGSLNAFSGSYTGDNTVNRAIPHGLSVTPKLVYIFREFSTHHFFITDSEATIRLFGGDWAWLGVTIPDAINFYVGNAISYGYSANATGIVYYWVAIG